ncbi:MAG: alpha/beta hydrolase [Flavobacteriales bacterium]|nr:alpha/beta hydrolase [Flavobacteriales bacterium]
MHYKRLFFWHLILICTLQFSCRIDELVLSEQEGVSEYDFTNAAADIDSAYFIDESLVNLFELGTSKFWALYLGDISQIENDTVILYCHGNGKDMDSFWDYHIMPLAHVGGKHRYGVMALDYRGFGNSEGEFNTDNFIEDVNACIEWLKGQGLTEERLVIMGNSLGAMPAVHGCTRSTSLMSSKLILDAPFPGITPVLQGETGLSLSGSTLSDFGDADNAKEIESFKGSLLWFHCKDDETVPLNHGKTIYDSFDGDKTAIICETGDHAPIDFLGIKEYILEVAKFIQK